ncbi:MAG: hypothetical protein ACPL07_00020 [Candidatus Bathyarchaeia archaeon]
MELKGGLIRAFVFSLYFCRIFKECLSGFEEDGKEITEYITLGIYLAIPLFNNLFRGRDF